MAQKQSIAQPPGFCFCRQLSCNFWGRWLRSSMFPKCCGIFLAVASAHSAFIAAWETGTVKMGETLPTHSRRTVWWDVRCNHKPTHACNLESGSLSCIYCGILTIRADFEPGWEPNRAAGERGAGQPGRCQVGYYKSYPGEQRANTLICPNRFP
jgi:hypothetical protein